MVSHGVSMISMCLVILSLCLTRLSQATRWSFHPNPRKDDSAALWSKIQCWRPARNLQSLDIFNTWLFAKCIFQKPDLLWMPWCLCVILVPKKFQPFATSSSWLGLRLSTVKPWNVLWPKVWFGRFLRIMKWGSSWCLFWCFLCRCSADRTKLHTAQASLLARPFEIGS